MNKLIRNSVAMVLTGSAFGMFSGQALALTALPDLGAATLDTSSISVAGDVLKRSWSDYGTLTNYGWTHTANFYRFAVGNTADVAAGTRFDVTVNMQGNGATPMLFPGFSIWTSGTNPVSQPFSHGGGYGHEWSQVRGPNDGGFAGKPCSRLSDCSLGSNGWMAADYRSSNSAATSQGNILKGRDGWIGYANAGYSFENGDGDLIQGRLAGNTNPNNEGKYWNPTDVTNPAVGEYSALTNVNANSPWVAEGSASLAEAAATLNLTGLRAGYYMIATGGSCPDTNRNGQRCDRPASIPTGTGFKLTITNQGLSAVPVPGAVWLFASGASLLGLLGKRRKQQG